MMMQTFDDTKWSKHRSGLAKPATPGVSPISAFAAATMPGVAIVKAEFAASQDDTQGLVDNIVYAANTAALSHKEIKML